MSNSLLNQRPLSGLPLSRLPFIALGVALIILAGAATLWYTRVIPAPNMVLTTLKGEKFALSDLRGKVVVVNFWVSNCVPCIREMPQLVRTYEAYRKDGVEFIAIAASYDPPSSVLDYAQSRHLPFKVALDLDGLAAHRFGDVEFTPTTFVIDRQGHIVKRYLGELDFSKLRRTINAHLAT